MKSRFVYYLVVYFAFVVAASQRVQALDVVYWSPSEGFIDAGIPHEMNNANALWGLSELSLFFNGDASGVTVSDFGLASADIQGEVLAPEVLSVQTTGNVAVLTLSTPLPPGARTRIRYLPGDETNEHNSVCLGFLPGDVNQSGTTNASDITALINCLNHHGTCQPHQTDINRSGTTNVQDITALINLLNGAGGFEPWMSAKLPSGCPEVEEAEPKPFTWLPENPGSGQWTTFSSQIDPNLVASYIWLFSDGGTTSGYGATVQHRFDNPGTFTITLRIRYKDNTVVIYSRDVTIHHVEPMRLDGVLDGVPDGASETLAYDVVVAGGVAWRLGFNGILSTVQISNPSQPAFIAEQDVCDNGGVDLASDGHFVALACNGLYLFDASRPSVLTPVATYDTYPEDRFRITASAIDSEYVYVVGNYNQGANGSLRILRLSDLVEVGRSESTELVVPLSVTVRGARAYVGDMGQVHAFDVSVPSAPTHLTSYPALDWVRQIELDGPWLAALERYSLHSSGYGTVALFDVSGPTELAFLDRFTHPSGDTRGICFHDGFLLGTNIGSLSRYSVSTGQGIWIDEVIVGMRRLVKPTVANIPGYGERIVVNFDFGQLITVVP